MPAGTTDKNFAENSLEFLKFEKKFNQVKGSKNSPRTYDNREHRKAECRVSSKLATLGIEIPKNFDRRYMLNFSILSRKRKRDNKESSEAKMYYYDFLQQKSFLKLYEIFRMKQELTIAPYKHDIINSVRRCQVTIIEGDTGCGKSTQVPQYLMEEFDKKIVCTQPRRISTIALCRRVSYETYNQSNNRIAYQIRFDRSASKSSKITFLTEGVLLRQMQNDRELSQYDIIIIDEVHERHISTDLLLAFSKLALEQRRDLRLVLMSATLTSSSLENYYQECTLKLIRVPGRIFPVEVKYIPIEDETLPQSRDKDTKRYIFKKKRSLDCRPYIQILKKIDMDIPPEESGDVLIFLNGMFEIQLLAESVLEYAAQNQRWIVLPLHSTLSIEDQDKIFHLSPPGVRKCIISTNIAETSLTIVGIRFVIDSGKVNEANYEPFDRVHRLEEFWISKSAAEQRKGRAGRTGPGICYRLYSQQMYQHFIPFPIPEIQSSPLESTLLLIKSLGYDDVNSFPFFDRPLEDHIQAAILVLNDLDAISNSEEKFYDFGENREIFASNFVKTTMMFQSARITQLGKMLIRLPIDLSLGKMLIFGSCFQLQEVMITLAALMSVQSIFSHKNPGSEGAAHKIFDSIHGDPFTLLNAFDEWSRVKLEKRTSRKWCKKHNLQEQRLYEVVKLRKQYSDILKDVGLLKHDDFSAKGASKGDRLLVRKLRLARENCKPKLLQASKFNDKTVQKDESSDEDEVNGQLDSLEFSMNHSIRTLEKASKRKFTTDEINLIKFIISRCWNPRYAIANPANANRTLADQTYLTWQTKEMFIHPSSVFFCGVDADHLSGQYNQCKENLCEILCFASILETHKTFLTNIIRIPGFSSCLLNAKQIDFNTTFQLFLIDNWLLFELSDADKGVESVILAFKLRAQLNNHMDRSLNQIEDSGIFNEPKNIQDYSTNSGNIPEFLIKLMTDETIALQDTLEGFTNQLVKFLLMPFKYNVRKLSKSMLEIMLPSTLNGIKISTSMRYGKLKSCDSTLPIALFSDCLRQKWKCPKCQMSFVASKTELELHLSQCELQVPSIKSKCRYGTKF